MTFKISFKSLRILVQIFLVHTFLISADMPPMPPMLTNKTDKTSKVNKKTPHQIKLSSIPDCSTLPPMIIFLPPPMEKSLIGCRNQYFKPNKSDASKKLSKYYKKKIKVIKVSVVENFRELYKILIKGKKKNYIKYCNKDLSSCLK